MTVVIPTDRPKSIRNDYVIDVIAGVFVSSTESDLFLFYLWSLEKYIAC